MPHNRSTWWDQQTVAVRCLNVGSPAFPDLGVPCEQRTSDGATLFIRPAFALQRLSYLLRLNAELCLVTRAIPLRITVRERLMSEDAWRCKCRDSGRNLSWKVDPLAHDSVEEERNWHGRFLQAPADSVISNGCALLSLSNICIKPR